MVKHRHGKYFYEHEDKFFIVSTHLRRGRAFMADGRVKNISFKSHPKICERTLTKGEHCPVVQSNRKEYV